MKVSDLRGYNVAFSDAEAAWSPEVKKTLNRKGKAVVMRHLSFAQKCRFVFAFMRAKTQARRLDLSAVRARGLNNEAFIAQQIEYVSLFKALVAVLDRDRAVAICKEIMDETAEALLLCLPEVDAVRSLGDPMEVFRDYLRVFPDAAHRGGCHGMTIAEDQANAFQFNVEWCVWLELAKALGEPDACIPNCYADDLVFPDYFESLGIQYKRTKTLACGGNCCDFRFERASGVEARGQTDTGRDTGM